MRDDAGVASRATVAVGLLHTKRNIIRKKSQMNPLVIHKMALFPNINLKHNVKISPRTNPSVHSQGREITHYVMMQEKVVIYHLQVKNLTAIHVNTSHEPYVLSNSTLPETSTGKIFTRRP